MDKNKNSWNPLLFLKDKSIDEEMTKGETELAEPLPTRVTDLSKLKGKEVDLNKPNVTTILSPQLKVLTSELKGIAVYSSPMKQLAISNPTARTIKIGIGDVTTDSYWFLINANKLVVLPPFNFDKIYWLQEGAVTGSIPPILFAYDNISLAPNISSYT